MTTRNKKNGKDHDGVTNTSADSGMESKGQKHKNGSGASSGGRETPASESGKNPDAVSSQKKDNSEAADLQKGRKSGGTAEHSGNENEDNQRSSAGGSSRYNPQGSSAQSQNRDASRGRERQWQSRRDIDREYSRDWDTLQNEQYGQTTQGSYDPRNNRQAWQGRNSENDMNDYRRPSRGSRENRHEYDDQRDFHSDGSGSDYRNEGRVYRGQQWGQNYAQSGRGFYDRDDERLYNEQHRGQRPFSRDSYDQHWQDAGRDPHFQRTQGYDEYGSAPENYGTQQYRGSERQQWQRNQSGQISDYENPAFRNDEFDGTRSYGNREYDNYGSEFDSPYDTGNRMRRRGFGEQSAVDRSFSRGYQYGNDAYNSGSNQIGRDFEDEDPHRNYRQSAESLPDDRYYENGDDRGSYRGNGRSGRYENQRGRGSDESYERESSRRGRSYRGRRGNYNW